MLTISNRAIAPTALATMLLAGTLFLANCAGISPESRVRTGLIDAGISPRTADCMAGRMVDRLSIPQLRRLQSIASLRKADIGALSVDRFLYRVRALEDPEIFMVTSKAALVCAL